MHLSGGMRSTNAFEVLILNACAKQVFIKYGHNKISFCTTDKNTWPW